MLIRVFPPHYLLVYINFDISSFSMISYPPKDDVLHPKSIAFATQNLCFGKINADFSLFYPLFFSGLEK